MNDSISNRKNDHLNICLSDEPSFINKSNGFDKYDFIHYPSVDFDINDIDFSTSFLGMDINYPFLISSMTGGSEKAFQINSNLSKLAADLNIPIGVGSQKQLLQNNDHLDSFKVIRANAPNVPVLSNIGYSDLPNMTIDNINYLIEVVDADALIVHFNPLQELIQDEGTRNFGGIKEKLKEIIKQIDIPLIAKEVGSGFSKDSAKMLLELGFSGIDVAGSGGTSWAAVELIRSNKSYNEFWDWGIPTSYSIRTVAELKNEYEFFLIGSGGINSPFEMAKSFALGADLTASAANILKIITSDGVDEAKNYIIESFNVIKKIMFLTNSIKLVELKNKIIKKEIFY